MIFETFKDGDVIECDGYKWKVCPIKSDNRIKFYSYDEKYMVTYQQRNTNFHYTINGYIERVAMTDSIRYREVCSIRDGSNMRIYSDDANFKPLQDLMSRINEIACLNKQLKLTS